MNRRIVCAALMIDDVLILGPRHFDPIMRTQLTKYGLNTPAAIHGASQGFIDQRGVYYNRIDAKVIAREAGQLDGRVVSSLDELFSEDLY